MAKHTNIYSYKHVLLAILFFIGSFTLGVVASNYDRVGKVEPLNKDIFIQLPPDSAPKINVRSKEVLDSLKQAIKDAGIDSTEMIVGKISYGAYRKEEVSDHKFTPFSDSILYQDPVIHGSGLKDSRSHVDTYKVRKGGYIWRKCPEFSPTKKDTAWEAGEH